MRAATVIREHMARYDLVQADLQRVLGLSQSAVSKRLRGTTPFDVNELELVAGYFGMTLAELIAEADKPRPDGPHSLGRQPRRPRKHSTAQYPDLPVDLSAHRLRRSLRLSSQRAVPFYGGNLPRRAA
jgi:transcriptional regulator with XRE-family HTH domain